MIDYNLVQFSTYFTITDISSVVGTCLFCGFLIGCIPLVIGFAIDGIIKIFNKA